MTRWKIDYRVTYEGAGVVSAPDWRAAEDAIVRRIRHRHRGGGDDGPPTIDILRAQDLPDEASEREGMGR